MKKTLKILLGIILVLAILLVVAEFTLDKVILTAFNKAAPAALGVDATLENASLSLFRGKASLEGLHIGNPEGYKTDGLFDLGSIAIKLDVRSLLSKTIIIREITIQDMALTYEKGLLNSNLGALIDQLAGDDDDEPKEKDEAKDKKEKKKDGKKVVIEKLAISGSKMNVSITGAAALTGGGAIPIPLPPITLTDLGKEKEGVTVIEAVQNVLKAILGAAGSAITGAGGLVADGAKAIGEGALAVGEGALDAGKAVVGGAADAGKAVVGGAADAGKAVVGGAADAGKAVVGGVGGALKSVNPFKDKSDD
ncbi:MAG: AsmA family protein [Lentisphaerae bacterium]|jgi:hypothetical protein|nr:AsmA family protein [Lentisphaerota bacterium]